LASTYSITKAGLLFRLFANDDFVSVFDERSGDTYLIGVAEYEIYQMLIKSPATRDSILGLILRNFPDDEPAMIPSLVDSAIACLERFDLIGLGSN
jgi:hypothetical protein